MATFQKAIAYVYIHKVTYVNMGKSINHQHNYNGLVHVFRLTQLSVT